MSKPGRVILTYGRSLMALVIARSLAERGVEVIGCDDVNLTVLSFSKHVRETFTVAPWDTAPEQFLTDLEAAVLEYAPTDGRPYVLMPVFREIDLITRNRARFEPAIKIAAPNIKSIELVTPKHKLATLAEEFGLDVPETWRPESLEALRTRAPKLTYPRIVKPVDGAGGRGVSCAKTPTEIIEQAEALGFDEPPLVQECIEGEDYCVAVLANAGQVTAIMAYRNVTTFPREAGAGAVRETVDAARFRAETEKLVAATNWNGVAEIDFRWSGDAKDAPKLIEVNARFWAGIFHSIESGVDFPWLLYAQTVGLPVEEEPEAEVGSTTKTTGAWLLAAIEDVSASDPHFNAARRAWRKASRRMKSGQLLAALEDAGKALGNSLAVGGAVKQLREEMRDLKDAPSELSSANDPMVGLGALFVLSSLVRHGKLPAEVTYKAEEPASAPTEPPPHRTRPVIGITKPERGDTLAFLAMKLAVWLAGGDPVKVTARAPLDPRTIDGLIFGGGADVYPKRYQGQPKPGYRYDLARGDMEASWAMAARRHDLPVLGVCRGAQMLNVLAGGTLHADLTEFDANRPDHVIKRFFHRLPVRVRYKSKLAEVTGCAKQMQVNAIHNQAIDRLGVGLTVSAREANGVIQAIEDPAPSFWLGVQFHPELLIYRAPFRRLFRALVQAAGARAGERRLEAAAKTRASSSKDEAAPASASV
ncbi:gamma-glutamyl-gamma-aminobutyrate hydrolase family protein [Terricaulis sp.]|uniref:gamma-glutamyl-gamma-aminobutyrate hydrolase family protein n=1 Tax=Terricaulis sp. TaxID=2768686 RepID=UPI002AC69314|nr:gamma-glutamyl-gamma-aminobutyrate hydrolase family protein [Terricaulis sp.]MDZ4690456.1 gamma-glutamyl-gamma-aminobutyrate hydrolase family protein [Terricaulis sp.]